MIVWAIEYFDIATERNQTIYVWGIWEWERVLVTFCNGRPGVPVVGIRPV